AGLLTAALPARPRSAKSLFAMANPTATSSASAPVTHDDPLRRQLRSGRFDRSLSPLPGAEAEVRRIAGNFPASTVSVVSGAKATESAYKSGATAARFVHFATHAIASDGQPLYSTLVLAPDAAAGDDGFLQAYEVLRTPLTAELVTLSACETASGSEDRGQGLVGLVAAFQQAGARSVLATLWSVDEATAEVTTGFYSAVAQGQPAAAALRQAKLGLLDERVRMGGVEISLSHPFFWAPFILVGAPADR
ncbi:MAG: CHAT domain-containing protein, partial [Bacteroidales bacterium]